MRRNFFVIGLLLLCTVSMAYAVGMPQEQAFSLNMMLMGLFGGLALFLLGLDRLTEALKAAAGSRIQSFLERFTTNRVSGALVGAMCTAMLQSSSVTTVLVVGFVSSGVMTLGQSVGIIMGANIGSTFTAQVIAFNVSEYALFLVAGGFVMQTFARQEQFKRYGGMLLGLGLIFFGMGVMTDAMIPLRTYPPFLEWMVQMEHPLVGLLIGALFTALIQSSAATAGLVIILASQGFISLPAGIALALGANIGTCVTAMLATIGKPRVALRAAVVHVMFNVAGVLLWVGFIDQLATLTLSLSPQYAHLHGIDRLAAEAPRQIANANTLFNVVNTLVFIGFAPLFARLVMILIPEQAEPQKTPIIVPKYLDKRLLDTPAAALNLVRMEVGHLGQEVLMMAQSIWPALKKFDNKLFRDVQKRDDAVDLLHSEIISYLSLLGKRELTEEQSHDYYVLSQAADTLERVGDIIESELVETGFKMAQIPLRPGAQIMDILGRLHTHVCMSLDLAVRTVNENDQGLAQDVLSLRREVNETVESAFRRQVASMAASEEERLKLLQLEFEITDKLKQIYSLSKRIARLYKAPGEQGHQ